MSPIASCIQLSSVPANAIEKNNTVSIMDPKIDPIQGACHHDLFLKKLKKVISSICPAMNAVPDATAIRQSAKYQDAITAIGKLIHATCLARIGPRERFDISITRYTSGKLNAHQVNQSLIGRDTRIFDRTITRLMTTTASKKKYFDFIIEEKNIFQLYRDSI